MAITIHTDLRHLFGDIRDQGNRPTCVAFATSDAHSSARGAEPMSVEHLYYHSVQRSPGRDPKAGVTLATILEALELDGQAIETGWPYLSALPMNLNDWVPPASAKPLFCHEAEQRTTKVPDVIDQLNLGRPCIVALMITESFCCPVKGCVGLNPSDREVGYHAVVSVAHGSEGIDEFLLIRNSWGRDWGDGGYAWIAQGYLEKHMIRFAYMTNAGTRT